jgi:hypothetical protein
VVVDVVDRPVEGDSSTVVGTWGGGAGTSVVVEQGTSAATGEADELVELQPEDNSAQDGGADCTDSRSPFC